MRKVIFALAIPVILAASSLTALAADNCCAKGKCVCLKCSCCAQGKCACIKGDCCKERK